MEDAPQKGPRALRFNAERQRPFAGREIEAILDNTDFMTLLSQAQSDRVILAKQQMIYFDISEFVGDAILCDGKE